MSTFVYVVGTPDGAKVNQYESMTNSPEEAERLAWDLAGPDGVVKKVEVKAPYKGRRK